MQFPDQQPAQHDQPARRSQRKTKRIDRNQHDYFFQKVNRSKGRRIHTSHSCFESGPQKLCSRFIAIPSLKDQQQLLIQMSKAFEAQSRKLYEMFKIKLQLGQESPVQLPSLKEMELIEEELDSLEEQLLESESSPQAVWAPQLKRTESAKMLCDNYENHELVYSLETLTPRLAKEDLDFRFIQEMQ